MTNQEQDIWNTVYGTVYSLLAASKPEYDKYRNAATAVAKADEAVIALYSAKTGSKLKQSP